MALTEEQKEEFKKRGEAYRKLKYNLDGEITRKQIEISKLEEQIRDFIPKTPNGRLVCRRCYVKSMAYMGKTPGPERDEIYECEICGSSDEERSL